jgi:hypothetical protein
VVRCGTQPPVTNCRACTTDCVPPGV